MGQIIFFVILSAVAVFILQSISIRIIYGNEFILIFDFMFFSLFLYPTRKNKKSRKFSKRFNKIIPAAKAFRYLLEHSDIIVHQLTPGLLNKDPAKSVIYSQNIYSFLYLLLTYIKLKSKSLILDTADLSLSKITSNNKTELAISINTTFVYLILTSFRFLFEFVKKRGKKIV